jgi:hypothetical protein
MQQNISDINGRTVDYSGEKVPYLYVYSPNFLQRYLCALLINTVITIFLL